MAAGGSGEGAATQPPGIRTFLIADVRGYTLFTQERGDEAAAKLAARFAEIAREVVEKHGGSVIELRGDEALAVFNSARQAILAAIEAQHRLLEETVADPTLPLPVGIGLDVGEAVPLEGGYRGGALNLAARLCGQAGPGEILASQGVIHLARKVDGVRVLDKGNLHLKGLTEPVGVYRLVAEDADPAVRFRELAPQQGRRQPAPVRLARRHPAITIVVAVALIAAVALPAGLAIRGGAPARIAGDAVAMIDLASGQTKGSIPLASRPGDVIVGAGSVWVTLPDRGTVQEIDPQSMTVRDTIHVGSDPGGLAIGFDSIWVTNGGNATVSRIDPATGDVVQTIDVPGGPTGIAVNSDGVWVASSFNSSVSQIDPETGDVLATIGVGNRPVDLAADASSVWVANADSGTVSRIDPTAGLVVDDVEVGNDPEAIALGEAGVWVANSLDGTVSRVDPATNAVAETIPVGNDPEGIALTDGSVWVSKGSAGSVVEIKQGSGTTAIPIGSQTGALAEGVGGIWVSVRGADASHRGGTLTVSGDTAVFDSLDPALAYNSQTWGILALTNDGLVGYRRTGGLEGAALVPDLALAIPAPSEGGRTYTFQLRPGIEYSTGESVRPDDFRRAIERVLVAEDADGYPSGGVPYYSAILGADACKPGGTCDLSEGVVADDAAGTVTFHLTEPDPDFLFRLALPFASAVPSDTPDELPTDASVPATGPYMIDGAADGKEIVLVRNPHFRSWSEAARPDGFADRIVWQITSDRGKMTADVLDGTSDLTYWFPEAGSVAGLASAHAGQLHLTPQPAIFFMSPNVNAPPFDDVRVRQALNLAVDRAKVQRLIGLGTPPTCQLLPPNFPGYVPYCPYTVDPGQAWTGPDLAAAERLVAASGTRGSRVTILSQPNLYPQVASYFRGLLDQLGYRAVIETVDPASYFSALFARTRRVDLGFIGWYTDYPSESGYLLPVLQCGGPYNVNGFCDEEIDRRMAAAARLQITDPTAAHQRWSQIDHDVVDLAPWIPLVVRQWVNLVSERLENFQVNPQYGPLIDQMWVR